MLNWGDHLSWSVTHCITWLILHARELIARFPVRAKSTVRGLTKPESLQAYCITFTRDVNKKRFEWYIQANISIFVDVRITKKRLFIFFENIFHFLNFWKLVMEGNCWLHKPDIGWLKKRLKFLENELICPVNQLIIWSKSLVLETLNNASRNSKEATPWLDIRP